MTLQLIGIDLAKNVFHLHGVDGNGREVFRKRLYRDKFLCSLPDWRSYMAEIPFIKMRDLIAEDLSLRRKLRETAS